MLQNCQLHLVSVNHISILCTASKSCRDFPVLLKAIGFSCNSLQLSVDIRSAMYSENGTQILQVALDTD